MRKNANISHFSSYWLLRGSKCIIFTQNDSVHFKSLELLIGNMPDTKF